MLFKLNSLFLGVLLLLVGVSAQAAEFETTVKYAYMIDYSTGDVLFAKKPETQMGPSSLTKLMTGYLIFQALDDGRIDLETKMPVSETAWRKGGSRMFVEPNTSVTVDELLQGIIVQSGNDACIVMAEGLAGSEAVFAQDMTYVAQTIGLEKSHFKNATGWPDKGHLMTVKDLVTLSTRIYEDFPQHMHYYSQEEFEYNDIKQRNRNKLLYKDLGVDGFKTGYTRANGYGMVVTAEQDGRRIFLAINGANSSNARIREAEKMVRHAFRDFAVVDLYQKDEVVAQADVWLGDAAAVDLVVADEMKFTTEISRGRKPAYEMVVRYNSPIVAPVKKGAQLAELIISKNGQPFKQVPLVAAADVGEANLIDRIVTRIIYYFTGE